jgi:hypothetical protein
LPIQHRDARRNPGFWFLLFHKRSGVFAISPAR